MTLKTTQGARADDTNSQVKAEAEGFEPSIRGLPRNRISSVLPSVWCRSVRVDPGRFRLVTAMAPCGPGRCRSVAINAFGAIRVPSKATLLAWHPGVTEPRPLRLGGALVWPDAGQLCCRVSTVSRYSCTGAYSPRGTYTAMSPCGRLTARFLA
jgi:hypothetical protein